MGRKVEASDPVDEKGDAVGGADAKGVAAAAGLAGKPGRVGFSVPMNVEEKLNLARLLWVKLPYQWRKRSRSRKYIFFLCLIKLKQRKNTHLEK